MHVSAVAGHLRKWFANKRRIPQSEQNLRRRRHRHNSVEYKQQQVMTISFAGLHPEFCVDSKERLTSPVQAKRVSEMIAAGANLRKIDQVCMPSTVYSRCRYDKLAHCVQ
eukprot:SAG31_NODE_1958_length_6814_cov_3.386597_8_plen_110_part_00